jgi:hypothetical protein
MIFRKVLIYHAGFECVEDDAISKTSLFNLCCKRSKLLAVRSNLIEVRVGGNCLTIAS